MDRLLATLIDAARIVAGPQLGAGAVQLAELDEILAAALSPVAPAHVYELASQLALPSWDSLPALTGIEQLLSHHPTIDSQLETVNDGLHQLLTLQALLGLKSAEHATLHITSPFFLRAIRRITLPATVQQPDLVLVGTPGLGERTTVILTGASDLLRRITITYAADSDLPRLDLRLESQGELERWAPARSDWQQQAGPEYDLDLLVQSRRLGSIKTREEHLPFTIVSGRVSLLVAESAAVRVVQTTVVDRNGKALGSCSRIVHARGT